MSKSFLIYGLVFISIVACRNPNTIKDASAQSVHKTATGHSSVVMTDKVLFQFSYKNNTWEKENNGQFIDSSGNIYSYKITTKERDLIQPKKGYISKAALHKNFNRASELLCTIPQEKIRELYPYIKDAVKGKLSPLLNTAYNQGDLNWYTFAWDSSKNKYKRVLLRSWGDDSQRNLNSNAEDMYNQLMDLMNNECY